MYQFTVKLPYKFVIATKKSDNDCMLEWKDQRKLEGTTTNVLVSLDRAIVFVGARERAGDRARAGARVRAKDRA